MDLVTANLDDNTVSVLLGNGDATFQSQVTYATGKGPLSVAVTDANGDNHPDLAVANSTAGTVSILLGRGDGTFQAHTDYVTGSFSSSVAEGDFNQDGKRDLAVVSNGSNRVSVLLGKGDGTYNPSVNYATGSSPLAVAVVDLNGDGHADLAVSNFTNPSFGNGTVSVFLGLGDGTFQPGVEYATGMNPASIAAQDLNGDGRGDVAVCDGQHVAVLHGNSDGTLAHNIRYTTGVSTSPFFFVTIADLNGDGAPDLTTANSYYGGSTVSVILNKGGVAK